jgi:hypothetical protein
MLRHVRTVLVGASRLRRSPDCVRYLSTLSTKTPELLYFALRGRAEQIRLVLQEVCLLLLDTMLHHCCVTTRKRWRGNGY